MTDSFGARIPSTAKRGDLAVIVTTSHDYVIGTGRTVRESAELVTVTSVTRDGVVKAVRDYSGSVRDLTRPSAGRRVLVLPAATVDATAAVTAYAERRYPSAPHSSMVPPFGSVDEARSFLRPFLVSAAA